MGEIAHNLEIISITKGDSPWDRERAEITATRRFGSANGQDISEVKLLAYAKHFHVGQRIAVTVEWEDE